MKKVDYSSYYWQNEKVRLRAMQPEDWKDNYVNIFDSQSRRKLQYEIELPPVESLVQTQTNEFVAFNPKSKRLMFTIETLDGEAVGGINLNSINERHGTFSIGIEINSGQHGRGYGTAAMRILLRYAFFERRLNKFNSGLLEGNLGSIRMHEKLGCVREGVRRQSVYTNGCYMDDVLYGLTKDEFIQFENARLHTLRQK